MRFGALCRSRRFFQFRHEGGHFVLPDDHVRCGQNLHAVFIPFVFAGFGVVFLYAFDLVAEKVHAPGVLPVDGKDFQNIPAQGKTPLGIADFLADVPHFHQFFHNFLRRDLLPFFQRKHRKPRGKKLQERFERRHGGARAFFYVIQSVESFEKRMFGQRFVIKQHVVLRVKDGNLSPGKRGNFRRRLIQRQYVLTNIKGKSRRIGGDVAFYGKGRVENRRGYSLTDGFFDFGERTADVFAFQNFKKHALLRKLPAAMRRAVWRSYVFIIFLHDVIERHAPREIRRRKPRGVHRFGKQRKIRFGNARCCPPL